MLTLEDGLCFKEILALVALQKTSGGGAPGNSRDLNIFILKMGVVSRQGGRQAPERKNFAFSELKWSDFVHILGGIFWKV